MLTKGAILAAVILGLSLGGRTAAGAEQDWVEVDAPNFHVISDAGEKRAEQLAVQFETIRAVYRSALTVASEHPSPLITVLAVKDEKGLSQLLPEYWATKGHTHPAGIFFGGLNKTYIALRLDAGYAGAYETIYHEYYHSLTVPYLPGAPVWLLEGTAEFFGHTEITGKDVHLGQPDPNLLAFLQEQRMPLATLMQVDMSSPYYNEQNKTSIFYAEAWALVHYLILGDKSTHQKQFADYLQRLQDNEPQEKAAQEAFGDLNELQKRLNSYVNGASYSEYILKTPDIDEKSFSVRRMSEAEIAAVEGDSFVRRNKFADAEPLLQKALKLDPMNVPARESLGFMEFIKGDNAAAERWMHEAIDLHSENYLVYYYDAMLSAGGSTAGVDTGTEEKLQRSIALNPNFAPAYSVLALSMVRQREQWNDALKMGQKAVQLEPGNLSVRINFGRMLIEMNRPADALKVGESAEQIARTPQERNEAEAFLSSVREYNASVSAAAQGAAEAAAAAGQNVGARGRQLAPASTVAAPDSAAKEPTGPIVGVDGSITDESCSRFELNLTVAYEGKSLKLHARNYAKIEFWSNGWTAPASFNPCADLKGLVVRVSFIADAEGGNDGEIQKIEVRAQPKHAP